VKRASRLLYVLQAAGKDAHSGAFVFIPAERVPKHAREALLLLSPAKLNHYFERGIIPQKGSFVELAITSIYCGFTHAARAVGYILPPRRK
jgi:hypothetical protein